MHAIHHSGNPAGSGMRNEQHILQDQLGWAEAVLDPLVVDADVPVTDLGIQRELPPVVMGVVHGFLESSEERAALDFRFAEAPAYYLDAFQDWFAFEMAQVSPLLMVERSRVGECFAFVKLADRPIDWDHPRLVDLQGRY